jgi:hypothetical protein
LVFVEERHRFAGPLGPGHDRYYASDMPATGTPERYPDSGQPGENAFDLRNPDVHEAVPAPKKVPNDPKP